MKNLILLILSLVLSGMVFGQEGKDTIKGIPNLVVTANEAIKDTTSKAEKSDQEKLLELIKKVIDENKVDRADKVSHFRRMKVSIAK